MEHYKLPTITLPHNTSATEVDFQERPILDHATRHKKFPNILQLDNHKNIVTKTNTGEAMLESVPQVPQSYHE